MPADDSKDQLALANFKKEIALQEYKIVVDQFRKLTDIRFQLLTYLPLGTAFAAAFVSKDKNLVMQPAIAAFAFVVTLCIAVYNKRNDQFYDELISRAAELERELQIEHGSFSDRPKPWMKYSFFPFEHRWRLWLKHSSVPVEHRWPIGLIYAAAAALWACLFVDAIAKDQSWLAPTAPLVTWLTSSAWVTSLKSTALVAWLKCALVTWRKPVAVAVVIACWRGLRRMERACEENQREAVKCLMNQLLWSKCATLNDTRTELAKTIAEEPILDVGKKKAERRIAYHWDEYNQKCDPRAASALLAAVIDLPARWIEDIWSGRR